MALCSAENASNSCVNALSWAQDGELLSGADDTTVRIWKLDENNLTQEYPFVPRAVIHTGHRGNIFSAKMLPRSSRMCVKRSTRDFNVIVLTHLLALPPLEIRRYVCLTSKRHFAITSEQVETEYSTPQTCIAVIRCHSDAVKKK